MRVLGIDVLSGSINSKSMPRYSVVLFEDGEVVLKEELDYRRLMNFIFMVKPDFLGVDNIFELFTKKRVRNFFLRLPEKTKVLQVNGAPERQEPLHVVARRHGIAITSRAGSMEEAEACARLASLGVGHLVELFEDTTKIIVSRARSMTRGGQSKDRYRRKVHNLVALNVKIIEQELKELGVEYSLETRKADSGLARGVFHVKAPRSELKGIKSTRGPDVQIKVLPVEKQKLSFKPLRAKEEIVILGVDPGTTTSIAAIDLDGRAVEVISQKEFSLEGALLYARKFRKVAVVATDVSPAPRFVAKLASKLNAPLFVPAASLTLEEKRKLVEGELKNFFSNPHERDSLAAAVKAYKAYRNRISKLRRRLKERNLSHLFDEALVRVLRGESLEIALDSLLIREREKPEKVKQEVRAPRDEQAGIIKTLREEIKQLRAIIEEKDREIEEKDRVIKALKVKVKYLSSDLGYRARKEREIKIRESKISYLSRKLIEEKKLRERIQKELNEAKKANLLKSRREFALIRVVEKFNLEEVLRLVSLNAEKGEVFYFRDSSGAGKSAAEKLLELEPRAIIAERGKMSHLAKEILLTLPVISPGDIELSFIDSFAIAEKEKLEELISREEEKIKIKIAEREKEKLESLINRYREERKLLLKT